MEIKNNSSLSHLVYSTDSGSLCPGCAKPKNDCICNEIKKTITPVGGGLRITYDTAGRKGKGMTLISGLSLSQQQLLELARQLKQQLGIGGAVKDFVIELQGDQRDKAALAVKNFIDKLGK